ncbi:MAG: N-acetylneuraminate synthase family protein [Magnetococcales bacterium]|nr:N-acetylneuraminate synthase family protein [Magnetococcales bacterium]
MSQQSVRLGEKIVGEGHPCYLIAEIGINHNGDVAIAKKLIDKAVLYGFDAVKFQKRTVDVVYSQEELARPRESPFGTTNGDLKRALEFGHEQFAQIDHYCKEKGIHWFASPWDVESVDFLEVYQPPCHKIASACLTDKALLQRLKATGRAILLSTGMSTLEEVDQAVALLQGVPLLLLHTVSTYPSKNEELNLAAIATLAKRYGVPVGYSGHEVGLMPSVMAVVGYGACAVERHVTLDRAMWGSDHAASIEPHGMEQLAKYIRLWPVVRGDGQKGVVESEVAVRQKLRRFL